MQIIHTSYPYVDFFFWTLNLLITLTLMFLPPNHQTILWLPQSLCWFDISMIWWWVGWLNWNHVLYWCYTIVHHVRITFSSNSMPFGSLLHWQSSYTLKNETNLKVIFFIMEFEPQPLVCVWSPMVNPYQLCGRSSWHRVFLFKLLVP